MSGQETFEEPEKITKNNNNKSHDEDQQKNNKEREIDKIPHPYDKKNLFDKQPPIPVFNFMIDNRTGKIIEDLTGKP